MYRFYISISYSTVFQWHSGSNLSAKGCDASVKWAFIVHGWEGSEASWITELVVKLLKYRGGCVTVLNWGKYSDDLNYDFIVFYHFKLVSKLLLEKLHLLEAESVPPDNIFMYGHSLGARMVVDAGVSFGKGKIGQIDGIEIKIRLEERIFNFPFKLAILLVPIFS